MKEKKLYRVTYRDSTVIFDGYRFEATSLKKAVKQARKHANREHSSSWSVYHVVREDTGREWWGPFQYGNGWGKS